MRRTLSALVILLIAGVAISAASARGTDTKLNLVGYAVPREALGAVIKAWQKTPDGSSVSFTQSYGASGDQARAVAAGLKADVVQLSTGLDIETLVAAGLVDPNWDKQSYKGIVTNSIVVFAVRDGNPKKIKGWNDLIKPGVQVVTPNPFASGAAKWNILAAYGAQRRLGKTEKQAQDYVLKLFKNVVSQDTSGRNATNTFNSGKGDVFITYENEARLAKLQYLIPRQTLLIEAPIAVIKTSENRDAATKFVRYTKTPEAQRIFAEYGFRPIDPKVAKEYAKRDPARPGIFTITEKYIGGWKAASAKWFNPTDGLMVGIEKQVGGPTG